MSTQIVICGFPRSGSTLLYNMLRSTVQNAKMPELEGSGIGFVQTADHNIVTKRPLDVLEVPKMAQLAAGRKTLKAILTIRDPRDLITSFHSRFPNQYFQGYDHSFYEKEGLYSYSNPGVLQADRGIRAVIESGTPALVVRYEELVSSPESVQEAVAEFTGLTFRGKFSDVHLSDIPEALQFQLNGVRPLALEDARWRAHAARVVRQFHLAPQLFEVLERWRYADDRHWFEELAAAVPQACDDAPGTIVGFYTVGTRYEDEARRLTASANRLNLPIELMAIERGEGQGLENWLLNVRRKPSALLNLRRRLRGPLLYIDVDAVVHRDPWPYLRSYDEDGAVAVHRRGTVSSATLFLHDTPGTVWMLEEWIAEIGRNPTWPDQECLHEVVKRDRETADPKLRIHYLPPEMLQVFDRTRAFLFEEPFIEQLQASREFRVEHGAKDDVDRLRRRRLRIAEINTALGLPVSEANELPMAAGDSVVALQSEAEELFATANDHFGAQRFAEAADAYGKLMNALDHVVDKRRANIRYRYGTSLICAGDKTKGVAELDKAFGESGGIAALRLCAVQLMKVGEAAEAWRLLDAAETKAPQAWETRFCRAQLLFWDRKFAEANVLLEQLLQAGDLTDRFRDLATNLLERTQRQLKRAERTRP